MSEKKYLDHFSIIATAGEAKTKYIQALNFAEENRFEEAEKLCEEACSLFVQAHNIELKMLQEEANGNPVEMNIIAVHAQDYLSTTQMLRDSIEREIRLYKRIQKLEARTNG